MLRNTFLHIPGVGAGTEIDLWSSGIKTWKDFLEKDSPAGLRGERLEKMNNHIKKSSHSCENGYDFLIKTFPESCHWRAYEELMQKNKCCFLDIETTGLSRSYDVITMIGLHDGNESRFFVRGKNIEDFPEAIKKYRMAVTFNGKCFDMPFIMGEFSTADMNLFHVDLRYELAKLGYRGGLKKIEKMLGINRSEETKGVDGLQAVYLWKRYKRGDKKALALLLKYNREDIENLKFLMDYVYKNMKKEVFSDFC